jgi:hypothetical protein
MGVMGHLFIVRRMALATIYGRQEQFFMGFISRRLVTCQTLNVAVRGRCMIFRHLLMTFHALVICIPIPWIGLRCHHKWTPDANGKNCDQ